MLTLHPKLEKRWHWSQLNRLLTLAILLFTAIFLCPPFVYLYSNSSHLSDGQVFGLVFGPMALLAAVSFGGGRYLLHRLAEQESAAFQSAFAPFGMMGETYLNKEGRRFAGLWNGRQVEIIFQHAQRFEWRLSTHLKGRWLISNVTPEEFPSVLLDPVSFAQQRLHAYGTFALKLAHRETAVNLLKQLLLHDGPFAKRTLELRNGRLIYAQTEYNTLQEFRPTAEQTTQIMRHLHQLLNFSENMT